MFKVQRCPHSCRLWFTWRPLLAELINHPSSVGGCVSGGGGPEAGHAGSSDDPHHGPHLAAGGAGSTHRQLQVHLHWQTQR